MRKVLKITVEWEYVIYSSAYPVRFHGRGVPLPLNRFLAIKRSSLHWWNRRVTADCPC